jgi:hypothetical protein
MKKLFTFLGIISTCYFSSLTAQSTLLNGLKAYYPCSGNMQDSSGFAHHGTLMNGATFTTDMSGNANSALLLDGIDDYVDIVSSANLRPANFPMTICAWMKPSSTLSSTGIIFANTAMQTQYGGQWLQVNTIIPDEASASYGIATSNTGPSSRKTKRIEGIVCNDKWHFIAAVFNGVNDITLIVDCKEYPSYYDGTLSGGFTYPAALKAVIGRVELLSQMPEYFKGAIDEVRFYDRALTTSELMLLCSTENLSTKAPSLTDYLNYYFTSADNNLVISATPSAKIENLQIRISDMLGQVIWEQNALSSPEFEGRYVIDNLAYGFYALTISNGKNQISQKFVKY